MTASSYLLNAPHELVHGPGRCTWQHWQPCQGCVQLWQSLLLPVLPAQERLLEILDAPVPFILGVQVHTFSTIAVALHCWVTLF